MARVAVDMPLPHLDRLFDYTVPAHLEDDAVPGCRVKVRFAGRQRTGFIIDRVPATESDRKLSPLLDVISAEPVLHPEIAGVIRAVADHYAGTFADVVRLAVPPRHGVTEKAPPVDHPAPTLPVVARSSGEPGESPSSVGPFVTNPSVEPFDPTASVEPVETTLAHYPHGRSFGAALTAGRAPRAALTLTPAFTPAGDWVEAMIEAAAATLAGDRGVLLLVPDAADLTRLAERCAETFGKGSFVTLTAEKGPAARYRAFLAVSRGKVPLVVGTRAAVFAPVANLGLIALHDDGDDSWAEPRAPYPHARVVAALRASRQRAGLLLVGYGRTAETQALVERGWLVSVEAPPVVRREAGPVVRVSDGTPDRDPAAHSRLPHQVFSTIRAGLAAGPVLIQVPRAGYLAALACSRCRSLARCPSCGHPLTGEEGARGAAVVCRMCGVRPDWSCAECGGRELRAPRVGVRRTAEELGRAFPNTLVVQSSGDQRVDRVGNEPALVLATPGAEPVAEGGYAAAALLDGDLLLARADLRAGEEALRRWLTAVALVRGGPDDGTVVLVADGTARAVQALIRLDPVGFAERELAERAEAGFPPAVRLVTVEGDSGPVRLATHDVLAEVQADLLGPAPTSTGEERALLRVGLGRAGELVAAAKLVQLRRTANKADGTLRVRVDPASL